MHSAATRTLPPDQGERERALDAKRSVLVQAPAGSGKTDLLTRRFLLLLDEVNEPGEIVAITFTKAAAAEMRHRILEKLEEAAVRESAENDADESSDAGEFSLKALSQRALERSLAMGWNLIDLPAQLRISTIDSFCRDLALQKPLLSGLGGGLEIGEQPNDLYRRAARRTLEEIGSGDPQLGEAVEALLLWRDNGWQDIENQLVEMLAKRDRWMHDFVLRRETDWQALRERLERPFQKCVAQALAELSPLLDQVPRAREQALVLARFACEQSAGELHQELAELAEFPIAPFDSLEELEEARQACVCLSDLLLTKDGGFRKQINKNHGFPLDRKLEKARMTGLIAELGEVPGLDTALAAIRAVPPTRYAEEDWRIVRACFLLLRRAVAELQVVFAEDAAVDYIEVAQIAGSVLKDENEYPSDSALSVADGIHHLLVDEFQDTSRRQHQLLAHLIAAWPEREGRTCFVVGDPMQSIYFFRDADAELFPRVEQAGLEIPGDEPLAFDSVRLFANFRSAAPLVRQLNDVFASVFEANDGSGVTFSAAVPNREEPASAQLEEQGPRLELHLEFILQTRRGRSNNPDAAEEKERIAEERTNARETQTQEIIELIRKHLAPMEQARAEKKKYRIAVLGRTRSALAPIAEALRKAAIPFRAVDLETLKERPEVLDALALGRALLNPQDRVAWLGVLRAPWCGLALSDLHKLVSADEEELINRPVPELLAERLQLLSEQGRTAAARVLRVAEAAPGLRFAQPARSLGTWLEEAWLRLGGAQCVDATARANLDLLWRALDSLPEGEQDFLGPALDAALEGLKALPDPDADSDCGVQLMTIHKSKGLEFEVVIVPDLQAGTNHSGVKLLSWVERGLAEPDDSGELTEFLVAPIKSKGADSGAAKLWVDRVYRARETQEMRRILYVAATRARDELHFFARPEYKTERDGSLSLVEPKDSLLRTAWPALELRIQERFDAWRVPAEAEVESIAAAEDNLRVMPSPERGALLRRLPPDYRDAEDTGAAQAVEPAILGMGQLYERHEGGLLSRALGTAVHALLQEVARLRVTEEWEAARAALSDMTPRIAARIRAAGVERAEAGRIAARALEIAIQATRDPAGEWILSPHPEAGSEVRWAGVVAGGLRTVQVDRVFRGGAEPLADGVVAWWIVDYKTAHEDGADPDAALPELRRRFAPQVEAYARVLRNLHGADAAIRCGLYYPRMLRFDWWEM